MDVLSKHLNKLLSALLHFAISETAKLPLDCCAFSIEDLTKKVLFAIEPIQREKGVSCVIGDDLKSAFVFADQERVEQILLNLIHNAIKASPKGSRININAKERKGDLVVSIEDAGIGMSPNKWENVFKEPSCTNGKNGNGVGLYICSYLVELHGGNIWFRTEEGKGSTFYFTLPKGLSLVGAENKG
jgi:signal transduction histidine kinase